MWYGQRETDRIISQYFDPNYIGNCIEIGVADGIKGSNTKYFEDFGWNVLCIEPIPKYVISAKKVRKNVIEYACGDKNETKPFFIFDIGEKNINSSLSSLNVDQRLLVSHGHLINMVSMINVNVRTLDSLLSEYWNYLPDFISIDTEGTELDVIRGINLHKINPLLLVVENNFNDNGVENYLKEFDYIKDQRWFVNDFYIKK